MPLVNLPEDLVSLKIELDSQETTLADHLPLDTATATCSVGPRQAECTFRTGVSRLARAASLADGVRDLAATLVLDYVPGGRPDELHLTVTGTHSGGAAVTDAVNYRFTPPATAKHNYALTSLTAARHDLVAVDGSPERVDEFHLATTVAELPRHVTSARFTISGDASLEDVTSTQAICAVTSSTDFICDNPGSEFGMDVAVRTDGLTKRTVTLGVEIPDSYVDDREDDNRRSLTLVPFPDPAIGALGLTGSAGSTFQVLGDVSLAGVGSPAIFHVTAPANTSIIADGCTPSTPKTDDAGRHVDLTCESSSDDFGLSLDVVLPNNDPGDLTVELAVPDEVTDRDVSNNEKSILLRPAATLPADVKIDAAVVQDVRGANIDVAVDLDLGALTAPVDHLFVRVEGEFVRLESATTAAASCGPASDNSFSCPASGLSGEARMMLHLHLEPGHAPDGETVKIYVSPFEHDSGRPFELHVTPGTVEQEGTATRP